jgi:hypothetical protein
MSDDAEVFDLDALTGGEPEADEVTVQIGEASLTFAGASAAAWRHVLSIDESVAADPLGALRELFGAELADQVAATVAAPATAVGAAPGRTLTAPLPPLPRPPWRHAVQRTRCNLVGTQLHIGSPHRGSQSAPRPPSA